MVTIFVVIKFSYYRNNEDRTQTVKLETKMNEKYS
jgi:hypothetical protein